MYFYVEGSRIISNTQWPSEVHTASDGTQTRALFATPPSVPKSGLTLSSSPSTRCLRIHYVPGPKICFWSMLRLKYTLYFCSDDFRKSPFPSFDRNITCIVWYRFHIEMKLFSETNPFQPHRFTLICGSWQVINSHFSCTFWLKRFSCRGSGLFFFLPAPHSFCWSVSQNRCVYKCKWYFCMVSAQAWPWGCMWETVSRWPLEQRMSRAPGVLITIGGDFASWPFREQI